MDELSLEDLLLYAHRQKFEKVAETELRHLLLKHLESAALEDLLLFANRNRQTFDRPAETEIRQQLLKHLEPTVLDDPTCEMVVVNAMAQDIHAIDVRISSNYTLPDDDDDDNNNLDCFGRVCFGGARINTLKARSYKSIRVDKPAALGLKAVLLKDYNLDLRVEARTKHAKHSAYDKDWATVKAIVQEPWSPVCIKYPLFRNEGPFYSLVSERLIVVLGSQNDPTRWHWMDNVEVFVDQELDKTLEAYHVAKRPFREGHTYKCTTPIVEDMAEDGTEKDQVHYGKARA